MGFYGGVRIDICMIYYKAETILKLPLSLSNYLLRGEASVVVLPLSDKYKDIIICTYRTLSFDSHFQRKTEIDLKQKKW